MSSRNLNGRVDGGALERCDADEEVAACDALPPVLRWLIKGSFVNTRATTVLNQWRDLEREGVPLEAYADWYARLLAVNQAKSCRAAYGADHPQAEPPLIAPIRPQRPATAAPVEDDASRARAAQRAAQIDLERWL
jgi:hypothetical protein